MCPLEAVLGEGVRGVSGDDVTTVSMYGVSGAACTPPSSKCLTSTAVHEQITNTHNHNYNYVHVYTLHCSCLIWRREKPKNTHIQSRVCGF